MPQETGFAEVEQAIRRSVVVPVIRTSTADEALAVAAWALEQRLPALELTATIPGWLDALRELAGSAVVGVGTLRTAEDARAACEAGARFLVSPVPLPRSRRWPPSDAC